MFHLHVHVSSQTSNICHTSKHGLPTLLQGLPVKTAPVQNGPSPKRPHFRLKRPQAKKKSVKTAPYEDFMLKSRREN